MFCMDSILYLDNVVISMIICLFLVNNIVLCIEKKFTLKIKAHIFLYILKSIWTDFKKIVII